MKHSIQLHTQDWHSLGNRDKDGWDKDRKLAFSYEVESELDPEGLAEQAFHITNAPTEFIPEELRFVREQYRGPSLSVGDVVVVDGKEFLCAGCGWETRELPCPTTAV